jgi:hypothetical protein
MKTRDRNVGQALRLFNEQGFGAVSTAALASDGLLDWPREQLRDLAINATIILRHGLEHYRELGEPTGAGSGSVRRTLLRHLTLFEHRLAPAAAKELHAAIGRIESEALAA